MEKGIAKKKSAPPFRAVRKKAGVPKKSQHYSLKLLEVEEIK
jgi:hypothetical protein